MQRHSGDTFSNRFRGISLLLLAVVAFALFVVMVRGCGGPPKQVEPAQKARMETLAKITAEQTQLLTDSKLDESHFKATLTELAPKIAAREAAASKMVVPGSPTQLQQAAPAPAEEPAPAADGEKPAAGEPAAEGEPAAPVTEPASPAPSPEPAAPEAPEPPAEPETPAPAPEAAPAETTPEPQAAAPDPAPEAPAPEVAAPEISPNL